MNRFPNFFWSFCLTRVRKASHPRILKMLGWPIQDWRKRSFEKDLSRSDKAFMKFLKHLASLNLNLKTFEFFSWDAFRNWFTSFVTDGLVKNIKSMFQGWLHKLSARIFSSNYDWHIISWRWKAIFCYFSQNIKSQLVILSWRPFLGAST